MRDKFPSGGMTEAEFFDTCIQQSDGDKIDGLDFFKLLFKAIDQDNSGTNLHKGQDELHLHVYDNDVADQDSIGSRTIDLKKYVFSKGRYEDWVKLSAHLGLGSHGELHVIIEHSECEDPTSVVSSVSYDTKTNSYSGFSPQLVNGLPIINQFQTNNYNELQQWFEDFDKSTLINANLVEPLLTNNSSSIHSRPYIISAYETNNKYIGIDVLRKWIYMYNECKKRNIIVVGFASDCEACYLKAMQISLGFFTHTSNIDLLRKNKNLFQINIPPTWTLFYENKANVSLHARWDPSYCKD
ncbi:unnamed protein product [Rotaria sp. Silwood1]|nr:unnamed protein product [Rotaria sp. Silwood1]